VLHVRRDTAGGEQIAHRLLEGHRVESILARDADAGTFARSVIGAISHGFKLIQMLKLKSYTPESRALQEANELLVALNQRLNPHL
jgi:hypothetical protein